MQLSDSILGLYIATILAIIAVPGPVVLQGTGAGLSGGPYRAARTNPQGIVFFASVFPQFLRVTTSPDPSLFLLTLVWIVLAFLTLMLLYCCIRRVTRPRVRHGLMKTVGAVQLGLAVMGGVALIIEVVG